MTTTFAELGLPGPLVQALHAKQIRKPFPIQEATIPAGLDGRDVCGMAPTGSGKTLAFGLPLLTRVEPARSRRPRALVLAPTRELAEQIKAALTHLGRAVNRKLLAVYGGTSYGPQKNALNKGVDVLVATPGRLEDLIQQGSVNLGDVDIVVVDEADRMADMGFLPAVRRILDMTSTQRQTMLFSATLDGDVAFLVEKYQSNPVRYEVANTEESPEVRHHFWLVERHDRVQHTAEVVETMGRCIVFTRTRHGADRLARQLAKAGVEAVAMHGGRSQGQRQRALRSFTTGRAQALVATDVAARGIHIDAVEAVIHFDFADDHKDFLHRSGRTGRAGAEGTVVSLVTREHKRSVDRLQRSLNLNVPIRRPNFEDLLASRRPDGRASLPVSGTSRPRTAGTSSLYVGNLPWSTTSADLDRIFSRYGTVHGTKVATRGSRSKGYGFVEMATESTDVAIAGLNQSDLSGRMLSVRHARPGSNA